jgi:hypothetical protein
MVKNTGGFSSQVSPKSLPLYALWVAYFHSAEDSYPQGGYRLVPINQQFLTKNLSMQAQSFHFRMKSINKRQLLVMLN